ATRQHQPLTFIHRLHRSLKRNLRNLWITFFYPHSYAIFPPMPKVCFVLLVAFVCSIANAQRSAIDTYAITNARIITVSGPVVERGTVVVRNGLIAAAGANVNAPPHARIIAGVEYTVYP